MKSASLCVNCECVQRLKEILYRGSQRAMCHPSQFLDLLHSLYFAHDAYCTQIQLQTINVCTMYLSKPLIALDLSGTTSIFAHCTYSFVIALLQLFNLIFLFYFFILMFWHLQQNKFLLYMYLVNNVWFWYQTTFLLWFQFFDSFLPDTVHHTCMLTAALQSLHRPFSPIKTVPRYLNFQLEHCSITTSIFLQWRCGVFQPISTSDNSW